MVTRNVLMPKVCLTPGATRYFIAEYIPLRVFLWVAFKQASILAGYYCTVYEPCSNVSNRNDAVNTASEMKYGR